MATKPQPTRLGISIRHVGFDPVYMHSDSERLSLAPAELNRYRTNRDWTPIFFRTKDGHGFSSGEFVANYLMLSKQTLVDLIPPPELAKVKAVGKTIFTVNLPIHTDGNFYVVTKQGHTKLKTVTLEVEFTVARLKTDPKKIGMTDMPFTVFSREADTDYLLARLLNFSGIAFQGRAGYFAHQACEKYLKALTVQASGEFYYTHELLKLAKRCAELNPYFGSPEVSKTLKIFDDFAEVGRYGGAARFDPHAQKTSKLQTAGVWTWRGGYIHSLDAFVFSARSRLAFDKTKGSDILKSIIDDDKNNAFVSTWVLRELPLREILTRENKAI